MTTHKAESADIRPNGRTRIRLIVEVDLDPVPGWGNEPSDWAATLRHYLTQTVGHYRPTVEFDGITDGVIPPGVSSSGGGRP